MTIEPRIDELPTKLGHALHQIEAQPNSIVITAITLFGVGAYKARTMVGHPGRSGLEMTLIGTVSALAGYFIGALFSVPATP